MSIKYGTLYLNNVSALVDLTTLINILSEYGFKGQSGYPDSSDKTALVLPNEKHKIVLMGDGNNPVRMGRGYWFEGADNPVSDWKIGVSKATAYSTGQVSSAWPPYVRYAINDSGEWILSFATYTCYQDNKYNYEAGAAYFIGTKINNKPVVICSNGEIYDDSIFQISSLYKVITRLKNTYYDSKQTNQIVLTDFLVRDNAYNIKSLDNIKLAITYKGGFYPYLIKDEKGNEYCIVPSSCKSESALVLRDTKE